MSGRAREGAADEARMQAVWDWAVELEKATGCVVQLSLSRKAREGVWSVQARLCEVVDGRAAGVRLRLSLEYPNSSRAYLGDLLLAAVMQLDQQSARDPLVQSAQA